MSNGLWNTKMWLAIMGLELCDCFNSGNKINVCSQWLESTCAVSISTNFKYIFFYNIVQGSFSQRYILLTWVQQYQDSCWCHTILYLCILNTTIRQYQYKWEQESLKCKMRPSWRYFAAVQDAAHILRSGLWSRS